MKKTKLLIFIVIVCTFVPAFSQNKIFHENGRVAYDSVYKTAYYYSGKRVFHKMYNTIYYENNKKAYQSRYKNIYYSNGSIAYNNLTKNVYYSNGNKAYDSRTRLVFDKNGKETINLFKGENTNYTIEDQSLKVTVNKYNRFKFELALVDTDFIYVTDLRTYFRLISKTKDRNIIHELKLR